MPSLLFSQGSAAALPSLTIAHWGFSRLWWLRFSYGCHPSIQRASLGSPDSLTQCRASLVLMTDGLSDKGGESHPEIHAHGAHWYAPERTPLDRAANQLFLLSSFVRCETFRFKSEKVPWNYNKLVALWPKFLKEVPEFQVFTASSYKPASSQRH